jgi:protein-S-isoprenylcysteine O-methyltransferase Ste14
LTQMHPPSNPRSSQCSLALRSIFGIGWFALWFFVAFPGGLLYLSGSRFIPSPGANRVLGVSIIAFALSVLATLVTRFVKDGEGTPVPLQPPKRIVARGLFARTRNPMYATYVAIALGQATLYRSWILFAYALGFAIALHFYVVRVEEPRLRDRFGEDYARYCEMSGRWLPRR